MLRKSTRVRSDDLRSKILPSLRGRVFHTTTIPAFEQICVDGFIKTNVDGSLLQKPRYHNAYFRARDCVSVCDLRSVTDRELDVGLSAYNFLEPDGLNGLKTGVGTAAFLFLSDDACGVLISWRRQMEEKAFTELVVPHIEAGHPGAVPLDIITEALLVTIDYPPPNAHLRALLKVGRPPGSCA